MDEYVEQAHIYVYRTWKFLSKKICSIMDDMYFKDTYSNYTSW